MKKAIVIGLFVAAALAAVPSPARAAGPVNFYIRTGVITDEHASFSPFLWTTGANFDINLSSNLFISADVDLIIYQLHFSPLWLTPSVLLNFDLSGFYIGAGISKFVIIGSGMTLTSDLLFKANAGFKFGGIKLQAFAYSPFGSFGVFGIGANIGFGF